MAEENRSADRRARVAQMRAQEQRRARNRKTALVAGGLAAALAVGGGGYALVQSRQAQESATVGPVSSYAGSTVKNDPVKGIHTWENLARDHVEGQVDYPMTPAVGGKHNMAWANCGVYDKEIPQQYAVHSLEHGAVWITTNGSVSDADRQALKSKAAQDYILMSPMPSQDKPVVLSAWGHQLRADSASDPRIDDFISEFRQGPQTPEPGAACSGAYDPNTGTIAGQMPPE